MGWPWIILAIIAGALITFVIVAVIEFTYQERHVTDWQRTREALRRAINRTQR